MPNIKENAIKFEHYETPAWAIKSILDIEPILTADVIDPCTGTGILAREALARGHSVYCIDIHDWGFDYPVSIDDYLTFEALYPKSFSVLMNPPFSKATEFVEKALWDGAEKVLCFQRFSWWESARRRKFWEKNPPSKVYICGDRASCWRHDIPQVEREGYKDPITGKKRGGTSTAHAWFIWDKKHSGPTQLKHIWKEKP